MYFGKPPCNICKKPKYDLVGTNAIAWGLWIVLNNHGRILDTMGGNILPLHIKDVRAEAQRTKDADAVTNKVLFIDRIFCDYHHKQKK